MANRRTNKIPRGFFGDDIITFKEQKKKGNVDTCYTLIVTAFNIGLILGND